MPFAERLAEPPERLAALPERLAALPERLAELRLAGERELPVDRAVLAERALPPVEPPLPLVERALLLVERALPLVDRPLPLVDRALPLVDPLLGVLVDPLRELALDALLARCRGVFADCAEPREDPRCLVADILPPISW